MNLRKRTKAEVDYACDHLNDYTGGYEYLPWLIWMRPMYLVGLFGNMAIGLGSFFTGDWSDWITWTVGAFFGVFAPTLIGYMLRRDYKRLKVGQSS